MTSRAAVILLALAAGLGVASSPGAAAGEAGSVTLAVRSYVNANKVRTLVWYGQVSSGAAGEVVEILGRDCLTTGFRLLAQTTTVPGGLYEDENPSPTPPWEYVQIAPGTTFRARWRDAVSAPVTWRVPFPLVTVERVKGRRAWRVMVNPAPVYLVMTGRPVELQRKRGGTWTRYRTARLVRKPTFEYGGATNHVAVFEVPQRGLTLRALVPAKSAAPCYLARASEEWRS